MSFESNHEGYPGAILLHQGDRFHVVEKDAENNIIRMEKTTENYHTRALSITDRSVNSCERTFRHNNTQVHFSDVPVTTRLTGYSITARRGLSTPKPVGLLLVKHHH